MFVKRKRDQGREVETEKRKAQREEIY